MVLIAVTCPYCQSDQIVKRGKTDTGKQRYRCQNPNCPHPSFLLNPAYKECLPKIKTQVRDHRALISVMHRLPSVSFVSIEAYFSLDRASRFPL